MADPPRPDDAEPERQRAEDETERRFNETLRKMLSTPPKPHKADRIEQSDAGREKRHEQDRSLPPDEPDR